MGYVSEYLYPKCRFVNILQTTQTYHKLSRTADKLQFGWGTPRSHSRKLMKKFHDIGVQRVLSSWAPVYDFCLLASEKIEAMVCYENELHDFVGGLLLVREAGGKITDYNGKPLKNDRVDTFLLTNGTSIHNKIINVLKE